MSAHVSSEIIRYCIVDFSFGKVLLAESRKGICSIAMAKTSSHLLEELRQRFPKVILQEDDNLKSTVEKLRQQLAHPHRSFDFSLDMRGTPFQKKVWQALCKIPVGKTATYREIACSIGQPTASRAVAGACAANDIAILIPCHRVVRSDGHLSGYYWGIEFKRLLLKYEGVPEFSGD